MNKELRYFLNSYRYLFQHIELENDFGPDWLAKSYAFIDSLGASILHGASARDYAEFRFYEKANIARKRFVTRRRFLNLLRTYNDSEFTHLFRNKINFLKKFEQFIGRSWLDVGNSTFDDFAQFIEHHERVIVKPLDGGEGRGIWQLNASDCANDVAAMFERLKEERVVLEERVTPGVLSQFNPGCVNTLRVVSLLRADTTEIIFATLRMADGDSITDNHASGGIAAVVDVGTGLIETSGHNRQDKRFVHHPVSGAQIIGFQIPGWDRVVSTVVAASKVVPQVRYVGWDVTINCADEVVVIEGNDRSSRFIQAHNQVGLRNALNM